MALWVVTHSQQWTGQPHGCVSDVGRVQCYVKPITEGKKVHFIRNTQWYSVFRPAKSPGRQTRALLSGLREGAPQGPPTARPGAITFRRPCLSVLSLFLGASSTSASPLRPGVLFVWLLFFPFKLPWDEDGEADVKPSHKPPRGRQAAAQCAQVQVRL